MEGEKSSPGLKGRTEQMSFILGGMFDAVLNSEGCRSYEHQIPATAVAQSLYLVFLTCAMEK